MRRVAIQAALPILQQVQPAAHQIGTALGPSLLQHHRIGGHEIRRRQRIQRLPGRKIHLRLVSGVKAVDAGGCHMPPLLLQQKGLVEHVEGPALPGRIAKAPVLLQGFDARRGGVWLQGALCCKAPEARHLARGLVSQLRLLAGRGRQMGHPVRIGSGHGEGRKALCPTRQERVPRPVEPVPEALHAVFARAIQAGPRQHSHFACRCHSSLMRDLDARRREFLYFRHL